VLARDESLTAARSVRQFMDDLTPLAHGRLLVRGTDTRRGDGLFATEAIAAGTYIFDYEGESLGVDEVRARFGGQAQGEYLMEQGMRLWTRNTPPLWRARFRRERRFVDAGDASASSSNRARFINHSRLPNCACQMMDGRAPCGEDETGTMPRAMIFASEGIEQGEELTMHYGDRYWEALESDSEVE